MLATYRQRMTTKQWREVLLAGADFIVFKGNPCHLKAKNIGAGVVEVYKDIPANARPHAEAVDDSVRADVGEQS